MDWVGEKLYDNSPRRFKRFFSNERRDVSVIVALSFLSVLTLVTTITVYKKHGDYIASIPAIVTQKVKKALEKTGYFMARPSLEHE
jgi:hypothetical protein